MSGGSQNRLEMRLPRRCLKTPTSLPSCENPLLSKEEMLLSNPVSDIKE